MKRVVGPVGARLHRFSYQSFGAFNRISSAVVQSVRLIASLVRLRASMSAFT